MPTLEDAMLLATQAHQGQSDKTGQPYSLHVLRVMFRLESALDRITGVLHDVVEDTNYTMDDLQRLGYDQEVLVALDCLTNRERETYEQFIARVKTNSRAIRVKIADIEDNMDIRRLPVISDRDVERLRRYRQAWAELTALRDATNRFPAGEDS